MSEHQVNRRRCGTVEHRARAKETVESAEKAARIKVVLDRWGRARALEEAALLEYYPATALFLVNQLEAELNEERESNEHKTRPQT